MSDTKLNPKVGDRVRLKEGVIMSVPGNGDPSPIFDIQLDGSIGRNCVEPNSIAEILPRPIQVGDIVRIIFLAPVHWRVVHILRQKAWVEHAEDYDRSTVVPLSDLERVP